MPDPQKDRAGSTRVTVSRFPLFQNDREAFFLRRPNRFRVEVTDYPPGEVGRKESEMVRGGSPVGEGGGAEGDTSTDRVHIKNPYAAHCPNPGRLMELLFPGTRVILERRGVGNSFSRAEEKIEYLENAVKEKECRVIGSAPQIQKSLPLLSPSRRKTEWTLVAVYSSAGGDLNNSSLKDPPAENSPNTRVVPLYSSRLNRLTEALILPRLFLSARKIQREVRWGNSQFDFFIEDAEGKGHFLEVKGCTLVAYGTGMFPDAPSTRAVRHLRELAEAATAGYEAHVVFVLTHGPVKRFIPNLHTDPEFAATLSRVAPRIQIHTAEIASDSKGWARVAGEGFPVELSHGTLAEEDRGSYLVSLFLPARATLEVGALGRIDFLPGWYVYAGSAQRGLKARIARHLRIGGNPLKGNLSRKVRRKKLHWHIDYLAEAATYAKGYPIASYRNLECDLARGLQEIGGVPVAEFGSTDCKCKSHLYWFPEDAGPQKEGLTDPDQAPTILTTLSRPLSGMHAQDANLGMEEDRRAGIQPFETDPRFVDLLLRFRHVEAFRSGAEIVEG